MPFAMRQLTARRVRSGSIATGSSERPDQNVRCIRKRPELIFGLISEGPITDIGGA